MVLQFFVQTQVGAGIDVAEPVIDIVGDDKNGFSQYSGFHIGKTLFIKYHTGGVAGRVDDDGLGFGVDGRGDACKVGNLRTVIWQAWDVCMKL